MATPFSSSPSSAHFLTLTPLACRDALSSQPSTLPLLIRAAQNALANDPDPSEAIALADVVLLCCRDDRPPSILREHAPGLLGVLRDALPLVRKGEGESATAELVSLLRALRTVVPLSPSTAKDPPALLLPLLLPLSSPPHAPPTQRHALRLLTSLSSLLPTPYIRPHTPVLLRLFLNTSPNEHPLRLLLAALPKLALEGRDVEAVLEVLVGAAFPGAGGGGTAGGRLGRKGSAASLRSWASGPGPGSGSDGSSWRTRSPSTATLAPSIPSDSDSDHPAPSLPSHAARLTALQSLTLLAQLHPRPTHPHLTRLLPSSPFLRSRPTLFTILESSAYPPAVRCAAAGAARQLLSGAKGYLAAAGEDRRTSLSFTSLSAKLGALVGELHVRLAGVLAMEGMPASVVRESCELAIALMQSTPYPKLSPKHLSTLLPLLLSLASSPDPNLATPALHSLTHALFLRPAPPVPPTLRPSLLARLQPPPEDTPALHAALLRTLAALPPAPVPEVNAEILRVALRDARTGADAQVREAALGVFGGAARAASEEEEVWGEEGVRVVRAACEEGEEVGVRARALEAVGGAPLGRMRPADAQAFLDLAIAACSSPTTAVQLPALSSLGSLSSSPFFDADPALLPLERAILSQASPQPSSTLTVRIRATCALADLAEAHVRRGSATALEPARWEGLARAVLVVKGNNEKLHVHASRALGSVLRLAPAEVLPSPLAKDGLEALREELRGGSNFKAQWNAAHALGVAFGSVPLGRAHPTETESAARTALDLLQSSRNLKVRINCAHALAALSLDSAPALGSEVQRRVREAREELEGASVPARERELTDALGRALEGLRLHLDGAES